MEDVVIITRDINGYRFSHYLTWDNVCDYITKQLATGAITHETQILAVIVQGSCIYSAMVHPPVTWEYVLAFFA